MDRISQEEIESALKATTWNEQRRFIEHVEELLMDEDELITNSEIQNCFHVLGKFVTDENKNLVQRSMKIIEALCQTLKDKNGVNNTEDVLKSVYQCLNDNRPNIREQSSRTINSLMKITKFDYFTQLTKDSAANFSSEGKQEILQILLNIQDEMSENDWDAIFQFLLLCYEDKSQQVKNKCQELCKNDKFAQVINKNNDKLTPAQKKIFQPILDRIVQTNNIETAPAQENQNQVNRPIIDLNTSAFSRKQRQAELKDTDGLFLIIDVSTFIPFQHRLSLDVRDVFDDEISEMLLSQQSQVRVSAIDQLRAIFDSSIKNFENSIDIVIRWCVINFLGWQLNVSQASLNLLVDEFARCSEKFQLTTKEVHIIVPIVLWCMATESEAFKVLLSQVRRLSKEKDFNNSLLVSLSLDHVAVIAQVFDELKQSTDIDSIKGRLRELSIEGNSMVSVECKKLLQRLTPSSPRNLKVQDTVSKLQELISKIKTNPDEISDSRSIFGFLLDMLEKRPTEPREIRYMLYCIHAFLSEPYLVEEINLDDFVKLTSELCEFSTSCPTEFFDALLAIGFAAVSIHSNVSVFDALLEYIGRNYETQTRRSFAFQTFMIGIQLISVSQNSSDLSQLRAFAKSAIGQYPGKDDLRSILCRTLLSEIVALESQQKAEAELFRNIEDKFKFNVPAAPNNSVEIDANDQEVSVIASGEEFYEFLHILSRLTRYETRTEAIKELLLFDEKFPGEKVVDIIVKLSPLLGKNIETMRNKNNGSRPSSRNSFRVDNNNDLNSSFGSRLMKQSPKPSPKQNSMNFGREKMKTMANRPSPKSSSSKRFGQANW